MSVVLALAAAQPGETQKHSGRRRRHAHTSSSHRTLAAHHPRALYRPCSREFELLPAHPVPARLPAAERDRSMQWCGYALMHARTLLRTRVPTDARLPHNTYRTYCTVRGRPARSRALGRSALGRTATRAARHTPAVGRTCRRRRPLPTACASLASRARCRPTRPNRGTLLSAPQRRQVLPGLDVQPAIRPAELLKPQATPVVRRSLPLGVSAGFKRQVLAMGAWQYVSCHARQR